MKKITTYQGKKVLVLGLGKSGVNAAKLLHQLGAVVIVNDGTKQENDATAELEGLGIRVITGEHPVSLFEESFDYMVKNPGIPYTNIMVKQATALEIPIMTEPELAFEVSLAPWISITGSNGKTTTTTLIQLMLDHNRPKGHAYAAGNIGIPLSSVAQRVNSDDVMVTELSSFQLMGSKTIKPKIAVLTNIYEAHLDYHGSREAYVAAKMKLVENQDATDYFVVNWDNAEWQILSKQTKGQVVPFSRTAKIKTGAYIEDGDFYYKNEKIMPIAKMGVPGDHNLENALAAIAVAKIMGQSNAAIIEVLSTFTGVKHRMQFVSQFNKRRFYNDSKATNMEATTVALKSFKQPIVLLAGGLDRGFEFDELVPLMKEHVKAIILFGETKHLMKQAAEKAGIKMIEIVDNIQQAVPLAYQDSQENDVILLSPACASWDQFKTFEQRGDAYIEAVNKLMKQEEN